MTELRRGWGGGVGKRLDTPPLPSDPRDPSASLCRPVKHPPAEPSRFISAPTKTPDKMGFDEVGWAFPHGWGRGPGADLEGPTEALGHRSS